MNNMVGEGEIQVLTVSTTLIYVIFSCKSFPLLILFNNVCRLKVKVMEQCLIANSPQMEPVLQQQTLMVI